MKLELARKQKLRTGSLFFYKGNTSCLIDFSHLQRRESSTDNVHVHLAVPMWAIKR